MTQVFPEVLTFLHSFANSSESGDAERKTSRSTTGRMTSDIVISFSWLVVTDVRIYGDGERGQAQREECGEGYTEDKRGARERLLKHSIIASHIGHEKREALSRELYLYRTAMGACAA